MALASNQQSGQPFDPDFDEGHKDYTYTPLKEDEIRLLKLLPGRQFTELKASLETYPLAIVDAPSHDRPPYEALSYCWGAKVTKHFDYSINILKDSEPYRIFIRPNLESALRQLRYTNRPRYLWVDALCINQRINDDLDEKNEKNVQIPRIHLIYNKAKSVCIWLGVKDDTSDDAMEFVSDMLNLNTFDRFVENVGEAQSLANFAKLLRRPWFNRRWIVQELAVAREATLYCGSKDVSWAKFAGAVSLFASKHMNLKKIFKESKQHGFDSEYLGDVRELGAYRLVHAASNFYRKSDIGDILENLVSLEEVVSMLTGFDAQDPRDIVYAVLALSRNATASAKHKSAFDIDKDLMDTVFDQVSQPSSPNVTTGNRSFQRPPHVRRPSMDWRARARFAEFVDRFRGKYRPDRIITVKYKLPVFEVYKDFLAHTVSHSKSIDIICRPWAADVEDLPSWITKKSGAIFGFRSNRAYSRIRADLLVGSAGPTGKHYSASQDSTTEWGYRPHNVLSQSLAVQGFVLDTIQQKLVPAMGGVIPSEWYKEWQNCQKISPTIHDSAFWRTLVADRGLEGQKPPPAYYELACNYAFDNRVNQGYLDTREMMIDCPSIVLEYLQRVQAVTWMRRLVLSRKHQRLGLVPYETKKKDLICILQGCSVPVILRRHDTAKWIKEQLGRLPSETAPPTIQIHRTDTENANTDENDSIGGEGHGHYSTDASSTATAEAARAAAEEKRVHKSRRALNAALDEVSFRQEESELASQSSQRSVNASNGSRDAAPPRSTSPVPRIEESSRTDNEESTAFNCHTDAQDDAFNINNDPAPQAAGAATHTSVSSDDASQNSQAAQNGNTNGDGAIPPLTSIGDTGEHKQASQHSSPHSDENIQQPAPASSPSAQAHSQPSQPSQSNGTTANTSTTPASTTDRATSNSQTLQPPPGNSRRSHQTNGSQTPDSSVQTSTKKHIHIPEPRHIEKEDRVLSWRSQTIPKYFYEFIGECYIHGMMDGEAMRFAQGSFPERELFDPKQGTRQTFWLR